MKKTLFTLMALALIVATCCIAFAGCAPDSQNVTIKEQIDYSLVLKDYLEYPNEDNVNSMASIENNVSDIFADETLEDADKVAQMILRATQNEIDCAYFSYFMDKVGTSTIGDKSGTLVYQRLRKQSDTVKDDTTIKLPVNHNFGNTEVSFVYGADIRYVRDNNKYYRMDTKIDNLKYNEETGLVDASGWERESSKNWNRDEKATDSRSYDEARKTALNFNAEGIVDSSKEIVIEEKTDEKGNKYYYLKFSIDVEVANADKTTIETLENDNSGKNMKYEYCDMEIEIWDCGLMKSYHIDESWSGKIGALVIWYEGSAQSTTTIVYSYSSDDQDHSSTESIFQSVSASL